MQTDVTMESNYQH